MLCHRTPEIEVKIEVVDMISMALEMILYQVRLLYVNNMLVILTLVGDFFSFVVVDYCDIGAIFVIMVK